MGAGKSTIGERCADRLKRPFIDTDRVIEMQVGRSVAEIFKSGGETTFRAFEKQAVADACASPQPLVISCGGGAVLDSDNRKQLRASGVVVWLRAAPEVLAERVSRNLDDRPLLAGSGAGAEQELTRLEQLRTPAYEATAHVSVDTAGRSVDDVVDDVLKELERCAA
jgi:shikimate kinase